MQKINFGDALASTLASTAHAAAPATDATPYVGADLAEPLSDAELEAKIEAAKPTAPRITKEHIQSLIVDETYTNLEGTRTTVCRLELANGFCVVGVNNGPVSAANFSQEIGCEYAYKAAVDQIWPLEGYLLAERLHAGDVHAEKLGKLRDLVGVQADPGNAGASEYHRGLANGLVLALSVFTGQEPAFVEAPAGAADWREMVRQAQSVLVRHAPPDGISDNAALTELYGILDKPTAPATTHQERVVKERAELDERLAKLEEFMNGETYAGLEVAERVLLLDQHAAMLALSKILAARIAAF